MTELQQQRFDRCVTFLRALSQAADNEACEVHWLAARNADPDQGPSYCRECCNALVEKGNSEHPDHEYLRDGGWGYVADGTECCDTCGKQLRCTLSDYGVDSELDNWEDSRLRLRGKRATYQAFDLLNVLESAYMGDVDECTWLRGHELERAKRIQKGVHRLTRRIDGIRERIAAKEPHHAG